MIVYISKTDDAGRGMEQLIGQGGGHRKAKIINTVKDLKEILQHPSLFGETMLLFAATQRDLTQLVAIRHLFDGLRIILILPNQKKETVSLGHLLRPRFVCTRDSNFSDILMVLQKMNKESRTESAKAF
jgi:hypothetical protein